MNLKFLILTAIQVVVITPLFAQSKTYPDLVNEAQHLRDNKQYAKAAITYSQAFVVNGNRGNVNDRYNAACAWVLAGNADSAFFQLFRIATKGNYSDIIQLSIDPDLDNLQKDKRWDELYSIVKQNKEKEEENLNKPLVAILDTVMIDDQKDRQALDGIEEKYGRDSKEVKNVWKTIQYKDSVNLVKVTQILDKYGWLGADEVGSTGNTVIFLVIQHADIKTQEKYLPAMREAVKKGKARPSSLALLEDRIALRQGRKQIYGSQIGQFQDGRHYVQPLEDPENVDKRRAEVGLEPLNDYTQHWQFNWDPVAYKKQLPEIEQNEKKFK